MDKLRVAGHGLRVMKRGVYTLANDRVFDQLAALLNSIEVNYDEDIPICIIPYDNHIAKVEAEVKKRRNVTIFKDQQSISRWEEFVTEIWHSHPNAMRIWRQRGICGIIRMGMHRRFSAFDGPYDEFIYLDADTLVMNSLDFVFNKLSEYDFVAYDYQYKYPDHVYNMQSTRLLGVFSQERIRSEIFCAGFFASRAGLFNAERKERLLSGLKEGESEILYPWAGDQPMLNYMVMRSNIKSYNFALGLPENIRTGTCVVSTHFENRSNVLYDKGSRLTYLHYIGVPAEVISRLCSGENINFPYQDIFLHYRYLREPDKRPKLRGESIPYDKCPGLVRRAWRKTKRCIGIE